MTTVEPDEELYTDYRDNDKNVATNLKFKTTDSRMRLWIRAHKEIFNNDSCWSSDNGVTTLRFTDNEENSQQPPSNQQQPDPVEQFMEEASRKGAEKVKAMSIEERTRRAMLAEAVEDRIFSLYDDLEGLLKDGFLWTVANVSPCYY